MRSVKIYLTIVFFFFLASACKKDIESLKPSDEIDATKAFSKVADLEQGLFGAYEANFELINKIYIGSLLADEVKLSNENLGQGQFIFKWQYSSSEDAHNLGWANYYVMIDRIHKVLSAFANVPAANDDEEQLKKRIDAELHALRGIAYYELLIRFMPPGYDANALAVPVVLQSDLLGKPARNTVGEVMTQIEADLAAGRAETSIPDAPTDVNRLSKAAIAAYQARAALLRQDWTSAIQFSTEALTLSGKSLATGSAFTSYWQDANEIETIWKYRNSQQPQLLWTTTGGIVYYEPSDRLKDQFDKENDIRFSTYFTIDPAGQDTALVAKYPGSARGPEINDLKIIRVAELYLMRAEAYAENSQLLEASNDINTLRTARIAGYSNISFNSIDDAIEQILNERFKELCYEGFRFFDLKRKNLPISRLDSDVQSANWQNLAADSYLFALPVPTDEIEVNPNMVQNPGY